MINVNDFVIPKGDVRLLGNCSIGRIFDYPKIMKLSENDFKEFYLKVMEEYRDKDGWWGKAGIPNCSKCNEVVSGPQELRRFYGMTLHPKCFTEVYEKEKKNPTRELKAMIPYWDRVANLKY